MVAAATRESCPAIGPLGGVSCLVPGLEGGSLNHFPFLSSSLPGYRDARLFASLEYSFPQ